MLALAAVVAFFTSGALPPRQPTGKLDAEPDAVGDQEDGSDPEGVAATGSAGAGAAPAATAGLSPPEAH